MPIDPKLLDAMVEAAHRSLWLTDEADENATRRAILAALRAAEAWPVPHKLVSWQPTREMITAGRGEDDIEIAESWREMHDAAPGVGDDWSGKADRGDGCGYRQHANPDTVYALTLRDLLTRANTLFAEATEELGKNTKAQNAVGWFGMIGCSVIVVAAGAGWSAGWQLLVWGVGFLAVFLVNAYERRIRGLRAQMEKIARLRCTIIFQMFPRLRDAE